MGYSSARCVGASCRANGTSPDSEWLGWIIDTRYRWSTSPVMKMPHLSISELLGVSTFVVTLAALNYFSERRGYRRKAGLVRAGLGTKRCARCEGDLGVWEGRFDRGDVHFNPGSYLPRISVSCTRCHAEQIFY